MEPQVPIPDDKDWTWVLDETCPACGFEAIAVDPKETGTRLRETVAAWESVLEADGEALRRRPQPDVWSPLEYACHVRDVHVLFAERLALMRNEDGPNFANWDQDATAIAQHYHLADPDAVRLDLVATGMQLADDFDSVRDDEWGRTGYRSDGAVFTIASFARYFLHDPIHHLNDVA